MSDEKKTGNEDQKKLTDDPAFQEMQKAIKGMALLVQQGQSASTQMQKNFETLVEKIGKPAPIKEKEPDPDDINDLDNVDLIKLIVGEVGKVVDEKVGRVGESIITTKQDLNDANLRTEVKELMVSNPDLLDWKSEMSSLAKDNPNLSLGRLHTLARAENSEKAEELDIKYKEDSDGGKKEDPGYLSLMPTGGGFIDPDSDEKPMTKEEASDKAWEETLESFPALGHLGEG